MDIKTEIKMEMDDSTSEAKINSLEELGPHIASKNNADSFQYFSNVPQLCFEKPCILGVDEAGRGPVLGKIHASSFLIWEFQKFIFSSFLQLCCFNRSDGVWNCILCTRER